jgi:hypothetical protein
MTINRRRAPSSEVSREKKLVGHKIEVEYAALIGGFAIGGRGKGDVKDKLGRLHSVKSGKKWQIFLYRPDRIESSVYLNVLKPCLDAFTTDYKIYLNDRVKCIKFKEDYVRKLGKSAAKSLSNDKVKSILGSNQYMCAKEKLALATAKVCSKLQDKKFLFRFLGEAMFNSLEVSFLAVKEGESFKVFAASDVLNVLVKKITPSNSRAGYVPEDYNVNGQKVLLTYFNGNKQKNFVEIEIRNDSDVHYREVRFNMYSKDFLSIMLAQDVKLPFVKHSKNVTLFGEAIHFFV